MEIFTRLSFLNEEQAKQLSDQLEKDFNVSVGTDCEGIPNWKNGGYVSNLLNNAINFNNISASEFIDYSVGSGIFPDFYIDY